MGSINTGLQEEQRAGVVDGLNKLLADEHVLYIKTRNYHWNVTGPRFHVFHQFLEDQYEKLAEIIDEVAENVRQFGGTALGTMAEFTKVSRLKEQPGVVPDENGILEALLSDHENVIRTLRTEIDRAADEYKAQDAADFLTAVLQDHNKIAWMLRSYFPEGQRNVEADRGSTKELAGSRR